jgi:hypothetical protein
MASSAPGFPRVGQGALLDGPPPSAPIMTKYTTARSADSQPQRHRQALRSRGAPPCVPTRSNSLEPKRRRYIYNSIILQTTAGILPSVSAGPISRPLQRVVGQA